MTAPEQINAWVKANGRKKAWLAEQVGCQPDTLSKWLSGKARPLPIYRAKLSEVTGLDIAAKDAWK